VDDEDYDNFRAKTEFIVGDNESVESLWQEHFRTAEDFDALFGIIISHLDTRIEKLGEVHA
jgi:hypothetical protein